MSDSVLHSLKLLGLSEGASWDEVNQAYRDMVRVWHPDRFEREPRLKGKAEEHTRDLNLAMQLLRKEYDPKKRYKQHVEEVRESASRWFKSGTREPHIATSKRADPESRFVLKPFLVYQRIPTSLYQVLGALIIGSLGIFVLGTGDDHPVSMATGSVMALLGLQRFIRHSFLLVVHRPILRVDQIGIRGVDTGTLSWRDVSKVWSIRFGGQICLAIEYSEEYVRKLSFAVRAFLKLRYFIRKSHIIVSCVGLDHQPNDVVRAVEAQHMIGVIEPKKLEKPEETKKYILSRIIAAACVVSILLRSLFGLETSLTELSIYIGVFSICEGYSFILKMLRMPSAKAVV